MDTRPPQVQCRVCGMKHRATVCPTCKSPTPSLAVFKGTQERTGADTPKPRGVAA